MRRAAGRRLLVFAAGLAAGLAASCRPSEPPQTVLLVIVDTLRADHLGSYGYERDTSPNLDRLAAEGERFTEAWAQAPWTLPAVASILTGEPPHVHGAGKGARGLHPVRANVRNVAERLHASGWTTAAVVSVVFCSPESGLARGFDRYDHQTSDASNIGTRAAHETTERALLAARDADRRALFLVVHYFDPHLTYDPPAPYDAMFDAGAALEIGRGFGSAREARQIADGSVVLSEQSRRGLVARYDGEIRYVDTEFGRLREGLAALGRWEQTLAIVVGDHGEEFWDHAGFEHGHSHHAEVLRVPLIVRTPGNPPGIVTDRRVRQIDIAPTILAFAGIESGAMTGKPLNGPASKFSVAEGSLWAGDLASVRSDSGAFLWDRTSDRWNVFGPEDESEHSDLAKDGAPPETPESELLRALPPSRTTEPGDWELGTEQLERLRSLGYIQ